MSSCEVWLSSSSLALFSPDDFSFNSAASTPPSTNAAPVDELIRVSLRVLSAGRMLSPATTGSSDDAPAAALLSPVAFSSNVATVGLAFLGLPSTWRTVFPSSSSLLSTNAAPVEEIFGIALVALSSFAGRIGSFGSLTLMLSSFIDCSARLAWFFLDLVSLVPSESSSSFPSSSSLVSTNAAPTEVALEGCVLLEVAFQSIIESSSESSTMGPPTGPDFEACGGLEASSLTGGSDMVLTSISAVFTPPCISS